MKQERFYCSTECSTVVWWKSIGERESSPTWCSDSVRSLRQVEL